MSLLKHMERWKDVEGYEGLYQVSSCGRVKSLNYNHTGKEKIMKPNKDTNGYLQVNLFKEGKSNTFLVHRLAAQAFLPNPLNLPQINHKDENKENNRLDNIEWCTNQYNCDYSKSKQILCVETNKIYKSLTEAYRQTEIHIGNISSCCNGKRQTAGGYHWKFID